MRNCLISPANVMLLLRAANYLRIHRLETQCVDFIIAKLSPEIFLTVYRFSVMFMLENLLKQTYEWMLKNFRRIVSAGEGKSEFVNMTIEELLR